MPLSPALTKKLGPLPRWAWGGIAGAGLGLYLRKRSASAGVPVAADTSTVADNTLADFATPANVGGGAGVDTGTVSDPNAVDFGTLGDLVDNPVADNPANPQGTGAPPPAPAPSATSTVRYSAPFMAYDAWLTRLNLKPSNANLLRWRIAVVNHRNAAGQPSPPAVLAAIANAPSQAGPPARPNPAAAAHKPTALPSSLTSLANFLNYHGVANTPKNQQAWLTRYRAARTAHGVPA